MLHLIFDGMRVAKRYPAIIVIIRLFTLSNSFVSGSPVVDAHA